MTQAAEPGVAAFRSAYPLRRILILLAAIAAPLIGYGQMTLGWGMSPAEFSAQGDDTLRVAGYAFAIWGVIYAWLVIYAVYQALPATTEGETSNRLAWPSFFALVGTGLWVVASAADAEWLTVAIITASLLVILVPLVANAGVLRAEPLKRRALIVWPLSLLAGWLTIASLVNLLTVLTSQGLLTPDNAQPVALIAVVVAVAAGLGVTARTRVWTYPVPIAWGLIGVFFAERSEANDVLAFSALGAAILIVVGATLLLSRPNRISPPNL